MKMRFRTKKLACFWFSYVVFTYGRLYMFGSWFRTLAVILVSDVCVYFALLFLRWTERYS